MIHPTPGTELRATRRQFLRVAGALTVGTTCGRGLMAAAATKDPAPGESAAHGAPIIQIGILMGTFSEPTLEARLDAVKACGLDCVQLSMDCAGLAAMPDEVPRNWPTGFIAKPRRAASRSLPCRAPST